MNRLRRLVYYEVKGDSKSNESKTPISGRSKAGRHPQINGIANKLALHPQLAGTSSISLLIER